ncbi:hypothetical protein G6F32_016042 [Rhizopus arrhizus]|nr:hypothetical protein G6F32_016042 [Rhizopus arrhizus]
MAAVKRLQHFGQPRAREILRRSDAQAALQARAAQAGARLALQIDDVARVGVQRLARRRHFEATRRAFQQGGARQHLPALDVAADGRGRQGQRIGGQREAAAVHHLQERAQERQVQHHAGGLVRNIHRLPSLCS